MLTEHNVQFYWEMSDRNLDDAEFAFRHTRLYMTVGRAYYAMFWAAKALLFLKGEPDYSSHGKVIGAFGRLFAKTGLLDPKYHRFLDNAFRMRLQADYGFIEPITLDDVRVVLENAKEFCRVTKTFSRK